MPNERRTRGASHDLLLVAGTIAFGLGLSSVAAGLHPLNDAGIPRASVATRSERDHPPRASASAMCACDDPEAPAGWHRSVGQRTSVPVRGLRGFRDRATATPLNAAVQRPPRANGPIDSSRSDPLRPGLGDKRRILTTLARAARNHGFDREPAPAPTPPSGEGN